ncbi:hypothetical protein PHSC3_001803 [Chlamydiales bacterium STE3]|nr:hypothetical protein PHSC3_001803 [Chlamydiales bacterium STE3]
MAQLITRKNAFLEVYGYEAVNCRKFRDEKNQRNLMRAVSYLPVVGFITTLIFTLENRNEPAFKSLLSRTIISGLLPFSLPIVDLVATIWKAKSQKVEEKNKSL